VRVDRLVRACTPAPGAWTTLRGKRVKLGPVTLTDHALAPGELTADGPGRHRHRRVRLGRGAARGQGARWPPPTGCAACASSPGERFA
jgi:methionyl-tRNA formyltransferase